MVPPPVCRKAEYPLTGCGINRIFVGMAVPPPLAGATSPLLMGRADVPPLGSADEGRLGCVCGMLGARLSEKPCGGGTEGIAAR